MDVAFKLLYFIIWFENIIAIVLSMYKQSDLRLFISFDDYFCNIGIIYTTSLCGNKSLTIFYQLRVSYMYQGMSNIFWSLPLEVPLYENDYNATASFPPVHTLQLQLRMSHWTVKFSCSGEKQRNTYQTVNSQNCVISSYL